MVGVHPELRKELDPVLMMKREAALISVTGQMARALYSRCSFNIALKGWSTYDFCFDLLCDISMIRSMMIHVEVVQQRVGEQCVVGGS